MKIVKCPACKQYVHFDCAPGIVNCWNCGTVSDFSRVENFVEKLLTGFDRGVGRLPFPDLSSPTFMQVGKVGVIVALPFAILMLLICNSFDISVVDNPVDSFASQRIPPEYAVYGEQGVYSENYRF